MAKKVKKVIVVGCGRLGAGIADLFCERNCQVFLIDSREQAFEKLSPEFSGFTVCADATDIDVLKHADISSADVLVSVTGDDNTNSVIAQIASRIYNIDHVYARLKDPDKKKLISGFNIHGIYPFELAIKDFKKTMFIDDEED